jgi:DNA topoisomerase-1
MTKEKKTLIIVESPAKCAKIEQYLGPKYKCIATYGHLRTILSINDIDIQNNFTPNYSIINEAKKLKQIEIIKKEIQKAGEVILSSDLDREGEMISYTLIELFNLPLNTKRITFTEITEPALNYAIQHPRQIDMNLVHAQQTRQILDILVGFKISPILWKCIGRPKGKDTSLSAGRCQTPALKLVYENQQEIDASIKKCVYKTIGYFTNLHLPFELNKEFETENETRSFLTTTSTFHHIYNCSPAKKVFKQPPEPLTTSRIQQIANNELHYSPKDTMRACQILYEAGYITYMRTDCKTYSGEFINSISNYIETTYAINYFNPNCNNNNNNKTKNSQEAHEAIRPTNISLKEVPNTLDQKANKVYKLIWRITLESCMLPASFYSITSTITAPLNQTYKFTSELVDFLGWKVVENKCLSENKEYQYLQNISNNSTISYKKICCNQSIREKKGHLTESRLVQLLEERGIGRPSTFSYLIDKIQERKYVKKTDIEGKEQICMDLVLEDDILSAIKTTKIFGNEKNKLIIQPLGIIVMEFLNKCFHSLFDYNYTNIMENALDDIANGELIWTDVCKKYNDELDQFIKSAKNEKKYELAIDKNHTLLVGKYGPVIKRVDDITNADTFIPLKNDIDMSKIRNEKRIEEMVEQPTLNVNNHLGKYEDKDLIVKNGKFGLYVIWGDNSKSLKEFGNRPLENINYEEVVKILDKDKEEKDKKMVREINAHISIKAGPKGDYIFYKTAKMKKPCFYDIKQFQKDTNEDYTICNIDIIKSWINTKYSISI